MKLTRRTFLKFLGLVVVPITALAKLSKPAKEKPFPERWTVTEEESEYFIDPDVLETLRQQLMDSEKLKEKQNHNAHQARIKSLARAMRQTQEIHHSNIMNRKA